MLDYPNVATKKIGPDHGKESEFYHMKKEKLAPCEKNTIYRGKILLHQFECAEDYPNVT